jgi:Ni,Fe-hydrogenase III component G
MEENIIKDLKDKFKEKLKEIKEASPSRTYIYVSREDLVEIIKYLFKDIGARFIVASGVDVRDGVEVLYHMAFDG